MVRSVVFIFSLFFGATTSFAMDCPRILGLIRLPVVEISNLRLNTVALSNKTSAWDAEGLTRKQISSRLERVLTHQAVKTLALIDSSPMKQISEKAERNSIGLSYLVDLLPSKLVNTALLEPTSKNIKLLMDKVDLITNHLARPSYEVRQEIALYLDLLTQPEISSEIIPPVAARMAYHLAQNYGEDTVAILRAWGNSFPEPPISLVDYEE